MLPPEETEELARLGRHEVPVRHRRPAHAVAPDSAVVVDRGALHQGARALHRRISSVSGTDASACSPVRRSWLAEPRAVDRAHRGARRRGRAAGPVPRAHPFAPTIDVGAGGGEARCSVSTTRRPRSCASTTRSPSARCRGRRSRAARADGCLDRRLRRQRPEPRDHARSSRPCASRSPRWDASPCARLLRLVDRPADRRAARGARHDARGARFERGGASRLSAASPGAGHPPADRV